MDKRRFFIRKIKPYGFVKSPSGIAIRLRHLKQRRYAKVRGCGRAYGITTPQGP